MIVFQLHRSTGIIASLIRWQTRSPYSHVSIVLPDGRIVESRERKGVRFVDPAEQAKDLAAGRIERFVVPTLPADVEAKAVAFWLSQVGKGYDYRALLRFVSRKGFRESTNDQWFCSELAFAGLWLEGFKLLEATEPWEVSPGLFRRSPLLVPQV